VFKFHVKPRRVTITQYRRKVPEQHFVNRLLRGENL
jgi:hypothetical protein